MALTHYERTKRWREKNKEQVREQKKRYYDKTAYAENNKKPWTEEEIQRVLAHDVTDNQLAEELGRSVKSIQHKRARLKS